jgi:hypothetical protein
MKLYLKRIHKTEHSTIGELYIDGKFQCYTLEDVEREVKIKNETAIPKGTYKIVITYSNRFKKQLPLLLNVPNFEGIRIHSGNTNHNTEGCILIGQTRSNDFIGSSRNAFNELYKKIKNEKNIEITIE